MKRKTSLIVWGAVLLLAAYGIYDLVREVRRSYTSCYAHTYSHAIGQMMGPRFDSLTPRGEGIRIGVVDAGFGGLRDDRFTRRLRVADYLDLTDGDTPSVGDVMDQMKVPDRKFKTSSVRFYLGFRF